MAHSAAGPGQLTLAPRFTHHPAGHEWSTLVSLMWHAAARFADILFTAKKATFMMCFPARSEACVRGGCPLMLRAQHDCGASASQSQCTPFVPPNLTARWVAQHERALFGR